MWNELWLSNPVMPSQPDKEKGGMKLRLTVDFAGPNSRIEPYPGHSPLCEELASLLQGATLIDKDDGISGYFQVVLHPDSQHLTGVYTPLGVRVFNVMPLGINVAPTTWNELLGTWTALSRLWTTCCGSPSRSLARRGSTGDCGGVGTG